MHFKTGFGPFFSGINGQHCDQHTGSALTSKSVELPNAFQVKSSRAAPNKYDVILSGGDKRMRLVNHGLLQNAGKPKPFGATKQSMYAAHCLSYFDGLEKQENVLGRGGATAPSAYANRLEVLNDLYFYHGATHARYSSICRAQSTPNQGYETCYADKQKSHR